MSLIAFQGRKGAYSDLSCQNVRPNWKSVPYQSFGDVIEAVKCGEVEEALLPCENALAGRVPEIHALLPAADLVVIGEYFHKIEHCLLGVKGSCLGDIERVHSHPVALAQVRDYIKTHHFSAIVEFDTAGAAELVAQWGKKEEAAIASSLAAELYGLDILARNIEDAPYNVTRFYHVARASSKFIPSYDAHLSWMTTMLVKIENKTGALYRLLGNFERYGINMTRIESYMLNGSFAATQFLIDIEAAIEEERCSKALKDLQQDGEIVKILGVYPKSASRQHMEHKN